MTTHTVTIGIGTNLGDRLQNIYQAFGHIAKVGRIIRTSFLYETPAAYITDQPPFFNAAIQLETARSPQELLAAVEQIMAEMGRVREIRFGPRVIDLDILFYDDLVLDEPTLIIPHPLMAERSFVLGPLNDMIPEIIHPTLGKSIQTLWHELTDHNIVSVTPIGNSLWAWGQKTYIMGIVNVTPDSFSGDGLAGEPWPHSEESTDPNRHDSIVERAVMQAIRFAKEGADCLDIGGQSTRPGHELVPVEEELARVVPVIEAIRQNVDLPISVDTFRWEVAEAALAAGAQLFNDIWGLGFSKHMAMLAADANVPLILMHNRMETGYASQLEIQPGPAYQYDDIGADVCRELNQRLELAHEVGVPRWNLIGDPGIGFGKNQAQQLALINRLGEVRQLGYPLLFGASRKGFIGTLLNGLPPTERIEGTLATNVVAIARGADIIRVHDVKEASRSAIIADAIVR